MTRRRSFRLLVPVVLFAAWTAPWAGDASPPATPPLQDEDVVRMFVDRRPVEEIVRIIRSRQVQFDLSEEMLAELRLAGVPEEVLHAMAERQAQMSPSEAPTDRLPATPPSDAAEARIRVRFLPFGARPGGERAMLWIPDRAGEEWAEALQLGSSADERKITGAAVFLACLVPDHVPDRWRSRSPLGRDFVAMPRHEMLAFHAGGEAAAAGDVPNPFRAAYGVPRRDRETGWLRLELPDALEATVEKDRSHDLLLGVAILVGDRYLLWGETRRPGVIPGEAGLELRARIEPSPGAPLHVEFVDPDSPQSSLRDTSRDTPGSSMVTP